MSKKGYVTRSGDVIIGITCPICISVNMKKSEWSATKEQTIVHSLLQISEQAFDCLPVRNCRGMHELRELLTAKHRYEQVKERYWSLLRTFRYCFASVKAEPSLSWRAVELLNGVDTLLSCILYFWSMSEIYLN